jgi:6-phosphogluconolactonase
MYVGTYTRKFVTEFEQLRERGEVWWKAATASPFADGTRYKAGGHLSLGLERFTFDDVEGSVRHIETITGDITSPQYLALHPKLPVIYAAEYGRPGRLLAFRIVDGGTLERLSTADSLGQLAISVSVHPSGSFAYVAHWGDGALTAFPLDAEGRVLRADAIAIGEPSMQRVHHHEVRVTPRGNGLLVSDNGRDAIIAYRSGQDGTVSSREAARIGFPSGTGPRHLEFHPSGRFVYVVGEWDSTLHVLEAEEGMPIKILQSYSTLPPGYEGRNLCSELDLHPDHRTLYVGNRGVDCVTTFAVDDSGGVEVISHQPSLGRGPSSVRIDPTGRHLIVGNVYSGSLVVFRIDDDGHLHLRGTPVEARAPRSLVFFQPVTGTAVSQQEPESGTTKETRPEETMRSEPDTRSFRAATLLGPDKFTSADNQWKGRGRDSLRSSPSGEKSGVRTSQTGASSGHHDDSSAIEPQGR